MLECLVVCTKPLKHTHSDSHLHSSSNSTWFKDRQTHMLLHCVCVWLRTACSRIVIATIRACGTSKVANKNSNMNVQTTERKPSTPNKKNVWREREREMPHSTRTHRERERHMHWRYQRRKTKHKTHEIKRFIHTYMRPTIKREKNRITDKVECY